MVSARDGPRDRRLARAHQAAQPGDASLVLSLNPAVYLVEEANARVGEASRPVDGVSLDTIAGVAEVYVGCGGHGIAAEHCASDGVYGDDVRSLVGVCGAAPAGLQPSGLQPAARRLRASTREACGQACMRPIVKPLDSLSSSERLIRPTVALSWGGM
ncbi:hypothetical protein DPSP01_005553 [Paraphaeosphaeria sporulosa]